MPFWKKSEDPWDIDPEKRKREPVSVFEAEPEAQQEPEGFFTEIAEMFKKKEEPAEEPPVCPWCGKLMERAYIVGGRDRLRLSDQKPTAFLGSLGHDIIEFNDEGFLATHKSCWQCRDCRKVVADILEPAAGPNYVWEEGKVKLPDGAAWDGNPVPPPAPEEIENQE